MIKQGNTIKLHVDALYWGTRRMVETLTKEPRRMARTDLLLEGLEKAAQPPAAIVSSVLRSPPITMVSSGGMASIDAVTGDEVSVVAPQTFRIIGPTDRTLLATPVPLSGLQ
jgi:hypothetical protein